ncbi:phage integrase family protein [Paraburkholderia guartelaensis]|uniref:phage integrase family protein n=1 Tax=Paraburkholderia TaxID=1822464 RepID=UPI0038B6F6FD
MLFGRLTAVVCRALCSARIGTCPAADGLRTIGDCAVRVGRRRRRWQPVHGIGAAEARRVEALLDSHPEIGERVCAPLAAAPVQLPKPWETLRVPEELNGTLGQPASLTRAMTMRPCNRGSRCTSR